MKNLKIRTKLLVLVLFMVACIIALGCFSLASMAQINESSTNIASNWLPSVITAEELNTLTSDYRVLEYGHIVSQDKNSMASLETEMQQKAQEIDSMFQSYLKNYLSTDEDKKLLESAQSMWAQYMQGHDAMIQLSRDNKTTQAMEIINGESKTLFDSASATFLQLVEFNKTGATNASTDGDELYASSTAMMIGAVLFIMALSILTAVYIILSIVRPVKEIDHVARAIADGNLNESIKYRSKDELGALAVNFNKTVTRLQDYVNYIDEISKVLNEIANGNLTFKLAYDYAGEFAKVKEALIHISDSLNDTMGQINRAADQVAGGSDQVSSGAQALSQGATEQASSIEELAATINEISSQIKMNADNANEANGQANSVGTEATESNRRMQDMLKAMTEISNSSSEIGKIIKTIEDIAFQTNILALNAAVEAARAGAAGKGFAVVADEVRNLASKSAEASKNTAELIESSLRAVENGTQIAGDTAKSLETVVSGIQGMVSTVGLITEASKQQAQSVSQVTVGVDQISSVIQTNSATAEESAAASEELSGQAQMLKQLVSRFKLKDDSQNSLLSAPSAAQSLPTGGFTAVPANTTPSSGLENY